MSTDPQHLIDTGALSSDWLQSVFTVASQLLATGAPPPATNQRQVSLLFAEASTRTKASFWAAAQLLGWPITDYDLGQSSLAKGESLLDTLTNLAALGSELAVLRLPHSDGLNRAVLAARESGQKLPVLVNAGQGIQGHPTQSLLDLYTIWRDCQQDWQKLKTKRLLILGDLDHSRVLRSWLPLARVAAMELIISGPTSLAQGPWPKSVKYIADLATALAQVDYVLVLRVQSERLSGGVLNRQNYQQYYRLDHQLLQARPALKVLHPGPVVNDYELSRELSIDPKVSLIGEQVRLGPSLRAAVMQQLLR